jgi:O-antigen/teichoic acid export membrane protein
MSSSCSIKMSQSISTRIKFLAKDSLLYGGAAAISKALSLITFPLLARYFTVSEFGLIDVFFISITFLSLLFIFGQDSAVARFFYEYTNEADRKNLISQSLIFQLSSLFLFLPVLWFFAEKAGNLLSKDPVSGTLFKICILQIPFSLVINFSQNLLKWTFSRSRFLIISLGSVIVNVIFILAGILYFKIGVEGVFVASLFSRIIFAMIGLCYVRNWLIIPLNFRFLPELLKYAVPFGIICVAGAFVPVMERSFIDRLLGSQDLGLYAAGSRIVMLLTLFIQAFQTAWGPFSLSIHKEEDACKTYNIVLKIFVVLICSICFFLSGTGEYLILLLASSKYSGASVIVFPLTLGLAVQATGWITEIGISISKKSYLTIYSYIVFVIITFLSLYFLIPIFNLLGVALGSMCGYFAKTICATCLAQRAYRQDWEFRNVSLIIVCAMFLGLSGIYLSNQFSILLSSFYFVVLSVLFPVFGLLVLFSSYERQQVRMLFQNKIRNYFL